MRVRAPRAAAARYGRGVKPSRGVLYMAASALAFSVMNVLVKLASRTLPTGEIVFARAIVTLILSYAMVRRAGLAPWGHAPRRLMFRGLVGFGGLTTLYLALARLPLADATTIQNATPVLTAALAWRLLGERIGARTAAAIAGGVIGVALIVHPSGRGLDPAGVAAALGSVTCSSIAYVTVRKLAQTEEPLVIVFYFPLVAAPLTLPWLAWCGVWPDGVEWLLLIGLGVATQVGQVYMTRGLAVLRAGRATTISYLQVVFAMAWQLVVFDDAPSGWTLAGAGLILASTLAVARLSGG
jgi:drug/metabolite transporter (DMT)-like permease